MEEKKDQVNSQEQSRKKEEIAQKLIKLGKKVADSNGKNTQSQHIFQLDDEHILVTDAYRYEPPEGIIRD